MARVKGGIVTRRRHKKNLKDGSWLSRDAFSWLPSSQ